MYSQEEEKQVSVLNRLAKGTESKPSFEDPKTLLKAISKLKKQHIPKPKKQNPVTEGDLSWAGIAELFNKNANYAFNKGLGWLRWSGARWQQVEETAVSQDILNWATQKLAQALLENEVAEENAFYAIRNNNASKVLKMLEAISFKPVESFEDQPWMLNCRNGIIDLRNGTIRPHERNCSLNQATAEYDPQADMSEWLKFVSDIFPSPEMAHYVQVLFGYAVTGSVEEELFSIFYGSGKNGKSTICNIISEVLGSYTGEIPTSELAIKKNPQDNSPHMARQVGKRILYANEPPDGMVLNDEVVKKLASRDKIAVCAKYGHPFDIKPSWLLILRCNNKPQIRAVDEGIWRRVKEVPFSVQFTTPDTTIDQRMIKDHSKAILRWLVEGAMEYSRSRFPTCTTVDTAVIQYRREQDSIEGWFAECVVQDPKAHSELSKLSQSYCTWCMANGAYEHSLKRLSDSFDKKGIQRVSGSRMVIFSGVKIK